MFDDKVLIQHSTLYPLSIDWDTWPSSFTINGPNVGEWAKTSGGFPPTYGWCYFGSQVASKGSVGQYGPAVYTSPVAPVVHIYARLRLKVISLVLTWELEFTYILDNESAGYVKTRRSVTPSAPSPIGTYTYFSSSIVPGRDCYADPYSVSA